MSRANKHALKARNVIDIVFWTVVVLVVSLLSFAVAEYSSRELDQRLERVHADGVALGAAMCGRDAR